MTVLQKDEVRADLEQLLKKSSDEPPSDSSGVSFHVIKGTFSCMFDFCIKAKITIGNVKEITSSDESTEISHLNQWLTEHYCEFQLIV